MPTVEVTTNTEMRTIRVEGEVDISNVKALRERLDELIGTGEINYDITIDLSGVDYVDSAVLELLVGTRRRLSKIGRQLTVVTRKKSQPEHVLRTCQFQTILNLITRDEEGPRPSTPTA